MKWQSKKFKKISVRNFRMIVGLPGMGNVGKIAIDFIIENLGAEKVLEIYSTSFPHCVFVNEQNMIELPSIKLFQKRIRNNSFIFLTGDIQPLDETSCYEFCYLIIDLLRKYHIKEIITLGGIGQPQVPKNPRLFYTGNDKRIIKRYKSSSISNNIYGVVGPIIGVSGLLLGTASQENIPAITILAETYGHPAHVGLNEAKQILKVLNKEFMLKLDLRKISIPNNIAKEFRNKKIPNVFNIKKLKKSGLDINYIG